MPNLKLEIFQNSKSQKCQLWGRPPPPFLEKVYILIFFFYDGFPKESWWGEGRDQAGVSSVPYSGTL